MPSSSQSRGSVLIPAGGHEATCQCVRSLGRRGIRTIGAGHDVSIPAFASKFCNEVVELPDGDDDFAAYRDALLELAARPDVATIIPSREEDAYLLSKYRDAFAEHVSLPVPSLDGLEAVHDRVELVEAARAAGVPVPETALLESVDDWSRPSIVKSRYNLLTSEYLDANWSGPPAAVKTITHLDPGETPDVTAIRQQMKHEPIVQEFVAKQSEYMVAALYDEGEPLALYQHEQIRGDSYVGGGGVYRKSMFDPRLDDVARRLLGELDWHGLACIEYIEDAETGEYTVVEINPRMWQSLPSTVCAGADFPYYYWLQATGRTDQVDPGYDHGVGCHRLNGEIGYLRSLLTDDSPHVDRPPLLGTLGEVVWSCIDDPNFDFLQFDDLRPFFRGVRQFLAK